MVDEWEKLPLGELTENYDGKRVPVKELDRRPGPFPYYGASGIVDHVEGYLFDGEYLLIGEDGENLRTRQTPIAFMASGKFWVNNHAHIVRGNARADTRFLCYALSHTDISGYLTGSTMPKLTQGNLKRIPIVAPPLAEQKRIAHILGSLDDKIDLNRRMNATLEAMARALFQSWIVDSADERMNEVTLGELVSLARKALSPADSPDEIFDHYSLPAFDAGRLPARDLGSTIKSNKTLVPADAVLLSKLNPRIPRVWLPKVREDSRAIASTEFLVLQPNQTVSREILFGLFSSPAFLQKLEGMVTGTSGSHQRVKPDAVLRIPVSLPTGAVIERYTSTVEPMFQRTAANLEESRTLAALRDTLLPKLLSGELTTTTILEPSHA